MIPLSLSKKNLEKTQLRPQGNGSKTISGHSKKFYCDVKDAKNHSKNIITSPSYAFLENQDLPVIKVHEKHWEGPPNILTSLFVLMEGSLIANLQTETKKKKKKKKSHEKWRSYGPKRSVRNCPLAINSTLIW